MCVSLGARGVGQDGLHLVKGGAKVLGTVWVVKREAEDGPLVSVRGLGGQYLGGASVGIHWTGSE